MSVCYLTMYYTMLPKYIPLWIPNPTFSAVWLGERFSVVVDNTDANVVVGVTVILLEEPKRTRIIIALIAHITPVIVTNIDHLIELELKEFVRYTTV